MILLERINLGDVSIEYTMERMKKGGDLRKHWKAKKDQMHFHIDQLMKFLMDWRERLEGAAFKFKRQWLHTNYLDSDCNASEFYGPREPGPSGQDYTDSEDEGDVPHSSTTRTTC